MVGAGARFKPGERRAGVGALKRPAVVPDLAEQHSVRLEVCAETAEGEIMGVRVRGLAVAGVQFHPESVLTPEGKSLLKNALEGGCVRA